MSLPANVDPGSVRSGVAALVGAPNVGKSTLLNKLLGQKISIVSPKPQTTRNRIAGIVNGPDHQVVILDTPGLHQAHSLLNEEMVRIALASLREVDVILFMIDATCGVGKHGVPAAGYLSSSSIPAILLLNKIDLVDKPALLPLIQACEAIHSFQAIIPISALKGDGTDRVLAAILPFMPFGPRLYPEDIPTDATERFIVAEIIREKIFLKTREEIPYATAVMIDSFQETDDDQPITIHATIFVEKTSQKGILIGKGGIMLKEIGTAARHDIERLLDRRTILKLWVKVRENWSRDPRFLRELGF